MSQRPMTITVLLAPEEFELFDRYCEERGFKKSTLIVRLIRQHLARESTATSDAAPLRKQATGDQA